MVDLFVDDSSGQAVALDILFFAAMVSLSAVILSLYWSGSYYNHLDANALRARYAEEFAQSFALTTRYISGGKFSPTIEYDLLPISLCGGQTRKAGIYSLSEILERSPLKFKPLSRKVPGSLIDIIADDVLFSLAIHLDGKAYPINNLILTGCYHENAKRIIDDHMRTLSGDFFDYRLEVLWRPMEGTDLENILYSRSVYGSEIPKDDRPLKIVRFNVVVPINPDSLTTLQERLNELREKLSSIDVIVPNTIEVQRALGKFVQRKEFQKNETSNSPINRAEATLIVWPKRE